MNKSKKMFEEMRKKASPEDIKKIGEKLFDMRKGKIVEVWDKVMALWNFVKDSDAPWKGKAIAIGALLYLIFPADAIPDVIPLLGLTDDASIIAFAISMLSSDLQKYMKKTK